MPTGRTEGGNDVSDVIEFIEALGTKPVLAAAPPVAQRAAAAGLPAEAVAAIGSGDVARLGALLGARPTIVCAIIAPEPDAPPQREDRPEPEPQPTPDEDDRPEPKRPAG